MSDPVQTTALPRLFIYPDGRTITVVDGAMILSKGIWTPEDRAGQLWREAISLSHSLSGATCK